jgi:hypothetical protein
MRLLVIASLAVVSLAAAQAGEIRLKDAAQCSGPLVRLADIAEVEGEAAADGPSLGDLVLFPAPATGKSRILARQELCQLLSLCDVPVRSWQFTGADAVEIKAGGEVRSIIRPALHLIPAGSHLRAGGKTGRAPAGDSDGTKPPRLVQRGGTVSVHSLAAGIRVMTSGKSLADAAQGENVLVELADTEEKILAKVVGPQLVEVRAGSK